jgi:hypothetical protein
MHGMETGSPFRFCHCADFLVASARWLKKGRAESGGALQKPCEIKREHNAAAIDSRLLRCSSLQLSAAAGWIHSSATSPVLGV